MTRDELYKIEDAEIAAWKRYTAACDTSTKFYNEYLEANERFRQAKAEFANEQRWVTNDRTERRGTATLENQKPYGTT